jgi:hypothetical protein
LDGQTDVGEATAKAVERPDRHNVHAPATRVEHHSVERWPAIFRPTHPFVDIFLDDAPPPHCCKCAKLVSLVIDVLIDGGYAEIQCGARLARRTGYCHTSSLY